MEKSIQVYHPVPSVRKYGFTAPNLAPAPRNPRDNDAVKAAPIIERGGHPPMPRPCYFITDQLLSLWPPIRRFSPPPPGGERWNGGNLRHLSRKISGQHARMHRVIWNIVEGPQQPQYWHCHVWTAPADQGFFCGVAFDRGCGHVFGLLMRVMTPVGPDVVCLVSIHFPKFCETG
jgi:hypothetical protein